jgi:hypothetical protein
VWIIVVSCFVGVSAAAAQSDECEPAALAAAFTQAFGDAVTGRDRSLPYAESPSALSDDRYRIDAGWNALLGMSSGSLLPLSDAGSAPQFWIFHVATESQASDSPPTVQFPRAGLTATVTGAQPRGARLRSGPDTGYPQVGITLPYRVLDVVAAVRVGGYDWLNVGTGNDWIRSDLVRVNLPDALATQRMAVSWKPDSPPYADAERRERCPLPSALMIQTQPGRIVAYDFNGLTLLQNGTAVITYDNFGSVVQESGETPIRFFFTNVHGTLETVAPGKPIRIIDPGLTFAVEFDAAGARRYVPNFTQDEQELGAAAWVFACNAANLYDQAVGDATGTSLLWYQLPCGASGAFANLHQGWSEVLTMLQAGEAFLKEQNLHAD